MVRLLLEDVTLTRGEQILGGIRFKGGATNVLTLPAPVNIRIQRKTRPETVAEIDRLLEHHHNIDIAKTLNDRGIQTSDSLPFTARTVARICRNYQLKNRYTRLREKGMMEREEMTKFLRVTAQTLKIWKDNGWIKTHIYGNASQTVLYELPNADFYVKVNKRNPMNQENIRVTAQKIAVDVV